MFGTYKESFESYEADDLAVGHASRVWSFVITPIVLSLLFLLIAYLLHRTVEGGTRLDSAIGMVRRAWHKRAKSFGNLSHASECQYLPFDTASSPLRMEVLVVDCTAPTKDSLTCTHHKKQNNPAGVSPADTSTGIVLNAIRAGGGSSGRMMQLSKVTTNHFDVDSFLSVWCFINKDLAVTFDSVLRLAAQIGDFREALLTPELIKQHQDGPEIHIKDVFTALKLVCWLNTQEKAIFSAPYVTSDGRIKFDHFLPRFADVLQNVEAHYPEWQEEYKQVVSGFDSVQQEDVETLPALGLAIVQAEEPLHYYSLFSHTIGCDYVLSIYDGNRYELEAKYTQFVVLPSRPVYPRLDFGPLASTLNLMESNAASGSTWVTPNFKDSGPLLRLETASAPLSKAQRYGHPLDRPFASSSISPDVLRSVVISFFEYGMSSCGPLGKPKRGGFTWEELHTINSSVNWRAWVSHTLEQHSKNELKPRGPLSVSPKKQSFDAIPLQVPHGFLCPRTSEASRILSTEDMTALASQLPGHLSLSPWVLTYCTQRDGYSLHTLYRKCAASRPSKEHLYCSVLVIQDSHGGKFGCVAFAPWSINLHRFYGTGETSVFQLSPKRLLWRWNQDLGDHHATDYFQFSSNEGLGVGGAGHFAIWVDEDLLDGSSNPCETFHSPHLAQGSNGDFKVDKLEVWHIV
jgi:hypothetical protein